MMGTVPNQEIMVQNDVVFIKMGPVPKHPKTRILHGFLYGKTRPFDGKTRPWYGWVCLARAKHVFRTGSDTYFRVRVMKWINQINPFESRQKSKLTLFDPIELQAGTERFPIVEAFCFNAL